MKDIIVGLDIGTSKIVALVAEVGPEGRLNIIGMGSQDSRGLKEGRRRQYRGYRSDNFARPAGSRADG